MIYRFGLMPEFDFGTIQFTLERIIEEFPEGVISTFELGVHRGDTSRGIKKFFDDHNRILFHTAVDNQRDFKMGSPFPECNFILGNSMEVSNQIRDRSQHFGFIDACHNYPMTMVDFLLYGDKIRKGGYIACHDTGKHIPAMKDYQGMGSKEDPDMYIACRKALIKLGLYKDHPEWIVVYDRADPTHDTGGITVFKKIA